MCIRDSLYAIPYELYKKYGVRRYGFHGTSHRYVSQRVCEYLGVSPEGLFAIFRRIKNGKSLKAVFKADKGHLHHRLMQKGYTQKQAVFMLYGITATFGMFAVVLLDSGVWKARCV